MMSWTTRLASAICLIAGAALLFWGIVVFTVGSYGGYYGGVGDYGPTLWWTYVGALSVGACIFSVGLGLNWVFRNGPVATTRGPRWLWGSLAVPLALILSGAAIFLAAPHCYPPPRILWPTYCGIGPSPQQILGASLLLMGCLGLPVITLINLSRRYIPLRPNARAVG